MKSPTRVLLLGIFLGLIMSGCATMETSGRGGPGAPPLSQLEPLVSPHRKSAADLEARGDLRGALNEWKVALAIDPKDFISSQQKKRIEERIGEAVSGALRDGREALQRGVSVEARRHFLAALALDPANRAAFDALQTEAREVRVLSHTVRRGETLAVIAQLFYGDRSRSEVIWETNQLPPNPKLAPGMVLKIPEIPGVPFVHPDAAPREARPGGVSQPDSTTTGVAEEGAYINPMLAEAKEALERQEFALALTDVDRFLSQNPRNPEGIELKRTVLYQTGKFLFDQRKYAESFAALNQLAKLAPNYQDSVALLGRAKERLVQDHYNQGIRLYREEKLEAAIVEWRSVLQYEPNHEAAKRNIEQAERFLKGLQQRQRKK